MKELQDQFEAEQYFSRLYKTQSTELRSENEEKAKLLKELEDERASLISRLQMSVARGDSEALARSIAEETVADLEKEKTIKELELKDLITKHKNELMIKENSISLLKDAENELHKKLKLKTAELEDAIQQNRKLQEEYNKNLINIDEMDKLKDKLKQEVLLKQTAVNKLTEIMNRKDNILPSKQKTKVSSTADMRKKEKEFRRIQLELNQEKEKYNQLTAKCTDLLNQLAEESLVSEIINYY